MIRSLKINPKKRFTMGLIVMILLFLSSLLLSATTQAAPPVQDPRPPVDDGGDSGGGGDEDDGDDDDDDDSQLFGPKCAALEGQVINWGVGNQAGVGVELNSGSWRIDTVTNSEGNYSFGGLGIGAATLEVVLAPEASLEPLIEDAAVYLNCNFTTFANIALLSEPSIQPPVMIEMIAPEEITAAENAPIRLIIKNDLPNEISNVVVTNLLPQGLKAVEVAAASISRENTYMVDGGQGRELVAVFLDTLPPGTEANLFITVTVAEDIPPNTEVTNTATFFYRESVATQASAQMMMSGQGGIDPPVASSEAEMASINGESELEIRPAASMPEISIETLPTVTALQPTETEAEMESQAEIDEDEEEGDSDVTEASIEEGEEEDFVPPDKMPSTGGDLLADDFSEEDGNSSPATKMMPISGGGLGLIIPLTVLGLIGVAILAYQRKKQL